jgi:hypothetical protein
MAMGRVRTLEGRACTANRGSARLRGRHTLLRGGAYRREGVHTGEGRARMGQRRACLQCLFHKM